MKTNRKLRIALECRVEDPGSGVGSAILGLAHALSQSPIQDQEYTFIVNSATKGWLEPYIFGPCRLVGMERPEPSRLKSTFSGVAPLWRRLRAHFFPIPKSDGYVESQNFDLVHFLTPVAYTTSCPTIYQPHDLQHLHYPQFFSKADFVHRENSYRAFCRRAAYVCVQAAWTKQDIVTHFGLAQEKVIVIPWGSTLSAYKTTSIQTNRATVDKYHLPDQFFFYPAVTWPHKNHEIIIRALHILKLEHGQTPDVYFTGRYTEFRSTLDQIAQELDVSGQIHYLGFLPPEELQAVFSAATAMIFASKFEGFGLPILEAFDARLPVLSSNATVLPEVAQDAALYFHPDSSAELATLMKIVLDDPKARQDLVDRGVKVLSQYSIKDIVAKFQVLYERAAALPLDDGHSGSYRGDGQSTK